MKCCDGKYSFGKAHVYNVHSFTISWRRPQGMYFSAKDKGEMMSMIYNWPGHQVDMIVLTDGSCILGLGDLGVQGIGIPIEKLDMYVAAAGISPQRIWDFGTLCWKERSIYQLLMNLWRQFTPRRPKAIVQFEDFQMKWAFERLQRYQKKGTAGVALAGLLGTVRAQDRPLTDFVNQKIVVVGAGSAGLGVFNMAAQPVSRMAGAEANPVSFLLDKDGLITTESKGVDPAAAHLLKPLGRSRVKRVKPHVLLGLSGVGGVFNEQVLKAMRESDSPKPTIFAMSNPTMNAECTAADVFNHAGENIVFASGSPFKNVDLGNATNSSVVSIYLSSSVCTLTFANHILVVREWEWVM
ncbi:hypothetical protein ACSBR1_017506 [Camellia fascicularis]